MLKNPRLLVAGLAAVALVLGGLIFRDIFLPAKNTGSSLNLYTVARRTVTASVSGTGNLVPMAQANVTFRVGGTLTEIDVRVGDHVTAGQTLARIDSTSQQQALAAALANLQTAQANLQSAQTPLTQFQIDQLHHNVQTAQQSYNDTVAQVNFTNTQDANQVAADQAQLAAHQQALNFNATYQADKSNLATAKTQLQTDIAKFNADGCSSQSYPYSGACALDFTTVSSDQTAVNTDQAKVNLGQAQVTADQTKLSQDMSKQQSDTVSGQRSINQASAQITSAQDQLNTQTETKPNQIASAQAQVASAQAAVQTAQQNLSSTTLVAPMDGNVNSINGVVGETVGSGGGTTAAAPGTQAPLPPTVALNHTNPALQEGITSNATVVVNRATNAVTVPNLAITRLGGQAYVNVYVSGQQVQTAVQTGIVGDQYTEITGGLNEGAQVVIPTLRVPTGSGGGRFGGGGTPVRVGG